MNEKSKQLLINNTILLTFSYGTTPVTEDTLDKPVGGSDKNFQELPIAHITTSKNNTKLHITDCNHRPIVFGTCGTEGFRNAKKNTSVAQQTLGMSMGFKAKKLGLSHVRAKLRGLGDGRLVRLHFFAVKGIGCHFAIN